MFKKVEKRIFVNKNNDNMIVDMDSFYQLPIISLLHPPKPIG
jgi:hypothetical protein